MKHLFIYLSKFFVAIILLLATITAQAQVNGGAGSTVYNNYRNIDFVVVFNGINNLSQLNYTGTSTDCKWSTYEQPNVVVSTQQFHYNIDNNKGYILRVDDKVYNIWVIDYAQHLPVFNALNVVADPQTRCVQLALNVDGVVPAMHYFSPNGVRYDMPRNFTLKYKTLEWEDAWKEVERSEPVVLPKTSIFIDESPLCDTQFTLDGDQFAQDLGLAPMIVSSATFNAVAVAGKITSVATTRDARNEGERPELPDIVTGSAPLDILFKANGNVPVARNYAWTISKSDVVLINRTDEDHRYTFNESGVYKVKLSVMNDFCTFSDSVVITVVSSDLQVPDFFTPNGDGANDEFRVGYKSIKTFNGSIFSRWGRKVFQWTDPSKGWDGNIGGRPAAEGAYFYVITAEGTDGEKYFKKGDITLLRGKQ